MLEAHDLHEKLEQARNAVARSAKARSLGQGSLGLAEALLHHETKIVLDVDGETVAIKARNAAEVDLERVEVVV